jgi:hypothetical protein
VTTGRKRGPKTPEGRARALANLRPFQVSTHRDPENHGVGCIKFTQPQTRALAEEIKVRLEEDGAFWVTDSDFLQIQVLALCLRRIGQIDRYLDQVGSLTNKKGEARPVLDLLVKLLREAQTLADSLGLTPRSRVHLGIDLLKGRTLAELMARAQVPGAGRTAQKVEAEPVEPRPTDAQPVEPAEPGPVDPKDEEAGK